MKYFLMYCGYPRSSHTLNAAILNANPNVYCSNQLFVLNDFEKYKTREGLFDYIKSYSVNPGTWKPTTQIPHVPKQEVTVVGDKTGHRSMVLLSKNPERLEQFKKFINMPIKWIHVVRNPFDNISTWSKLEYEIKLKKGIKTTIHNEMNIIIEEYNLLNNTISKLKEKENILMVRHEFLITRMDKTLKDMSQFLEISFDPKWIDNVKSSVWKQPRITRRQIPWNIELRKKVNNIISKYEWFSGYAYGCGCRRGK